MFKRRIIDFHQDEFKDWIADLECGHSQHMRHNPPWQNRPWIIKKSSRQQQLGRLINCKVCTEAK